ncbi:lysozyme inhibitor LprI family protein [Paracoccus sp. (in: a-proteobacteria)]|uniref:lysozyme inhibitor LprI family protein n=1 Tax=Paracoccus sp. TaxID=267 RepID=UPI0026DEA5D4|nr:lysozyme inhibitor LprI family protein [Paracoccus sp. (in: a-proteobacteria)]MDO5646444.1 lysozyme inhibitor LprI family protein [Paracoccus sp. (in: a-proteobacteria)]
MIRAAALILLMALPAAGQGVVVDAQMVRACQDQPGAFDCLGVMALDCIAELDPATPQGAQNCIVTEMMWQAAPDDRGYDPAILTGCLSHHTGADRTTCIGLAAHICIEGAAEPAVTTDLLCIGAEGDQWAALLADYRDILARQTDDDPLALALAPAWTAWRDAACAHEAGGADVEGADRIPRLACEMRLTAAEALRLEQVLGYEGFPE